LGVYAGISWAGVTSLVVAVSKAMGAFGEVRRSLICHFVVGFGQHPPRPAAAAPRVGRDPENIGTPLHLC
jgi:hypothetical protein